MKRFFLFQKQQTAVTVFMAFPLSFGHDHHGILSSLVGTLTCCKMAASSVLLWCLNSMLAAARERQSRHNVNVAPATILV